MQNHEFTAFYHKAEKRWVWVDACWNGSGDYKNGEYKDKACHEKFFDITDEALALDHRADYAERRLFFEAKAADPEKTSEVTDIPHEESAETTSETQKVTSITEETTSFTDITEDYPVKPAEDNAGLVIIVCVLGVLVAGAGVAVFVILKRNKSS